MCLDVCVMLSLCSPQYLPAAMSTCRNLYLPQRLPAAAATRHNGYLLGA